MDLDIDFPLKLYINLGRRDDRRVHMLNSFDAVGIEAARVAAIDTAPPTSGASAASSS